MATLAEIMDEMADQLRGVIDDVTDVDVQVEGRMVLDPTPPCVDIFPADPSDDGTLAAMGELDGGELLTIRARVSTADNYAGQELLLAFMDDEDPLSIRLALQDDTSLNGLANDVVVRSRSGYVLVPDPGGEGALLGCLWNVVVLKAHS